MSFVIAQPEMIAAAAGELASIRSAINAANAAAAAQTTGVMSAAADEVSTAVAALFSSHAQAYQAASAQAAAFHAQVVRTLTVDAGAYASAEAANAGPNMLAAVNAPAQALLGRPLIGNGANGAPGTGQAGGDGGLFCPVPATPLAPLPISGRPVSVCTGELMASRAVWPTICNGDELAASALAY